MRIAEVTETGSAKLVKAAHPQLVRWSVFSKRASVLGWGGVKLGDWKLPSGPVPCGEEEALLENEATEPTQGEKQGGAADVPQLSSPGPVSL